VRANEIVEAIDTAAVGRLPLIAGRHGGLHQYRDAPLPVLDLLSVLEPCRGRNAGRARADPDRGDGAGDAHASADGRRFGEIAEVLAERLTALPPLVTHRHMFADQALAPNGDQDGELIVMLRTDRLCDGVAAERSAA